MKQSKTRNKSINEYITQSLLKKGLLASEFSNGNIRC